MKNGGLILCSAVAACEMFKTSWQMGKHLMRDDLENQFNGPIIPFGAMVAHVPISAKDQSRLHQFGEKVLPNIFLGYALVAGRESGRETCWLQTLRSWEN